MTIPSPPPPVTQQETLGNLVRFLDGALEDRENDEEPRTYVGVSALGRCARATAMSVQPEKYPGVISVESLRFFNEGRLAEADIVERLQSAGYPVYDYQKRVTFPVGHPLHEKVWGHIDGKVPLDPSATSGPLAILEIKSLRVGALKKLEQEGSVSLAWPHYGIQAHTYAYCEGLQWVAFIIKDRNSGEVRCTWEPFDPVWVEQGMRQGIRVLDALDREVLPERDYNPSTDWQCKAAYCQWRACCLSNP